MEIIFHSHANEIHFDKKGCVPSLILKVRVFWNSEEAYSHSLSGLKYISSPYASLNDYFSFLSHFLGQWTVNKCHIWILEETIKYHYPELVANAKRNEEVIV